MKLREIIIAGLLLLGVFYMGRCSAPTPQPIHTTETVMDTTIVDSLYQEITYWQELANPDTVFVELEIPQPVEREGVRHYTIPYSDDHLVATIGLGVLGFLQSANLDYSLRRQMVHERTLTINKERTIERVITREYEHRPPRFSQSLEVGMKINDNFNQNLYLHYSPELRILGDVSVAGHAHLSEQSYVGIGLKYRF